MSEQDLKNHPSTRSLVVIEASDRRAKRYVCEESMCQYAEVTDTIRLSELLHRDEYHPVAAIRHPNDVSPYIRVYFRQLHSTSIVANNDLVSSLIAKRNVVS